MRCRGDCLSLEGDQEDGDTEGEVQTSEEDRKEEGGPVHLSHRCTSVLRFLLQSTTLRHLLSVRHL